MRIMKRSRIVKYFGVSLYRFTAANPPHVIALQRSFAMRMSNRQDNRNLYVFTYTNSTYLAWHLFADQGDGWWFWRVLGYFDDHFMPPFGFFVNVASLNSFVQPDQLAIALCLPA